MEIKNTEACDIDLIYEFYDHASAYQRKINAVVIWPSFDREMVMTEILESRQWQLLIDGNVACVWATTEDDPQIWEERNVDKAVYIHRIAIHPDFRGNNLVGNIVDWAKAYAAKHGLDYVRLDTLGENTRLIKHYTDMGFDYLGLWKLKEWSGLPLHYHDEVVCFFEIDLRTQPDFSTE